MNNFKKIGLSALAGSLVAFSVNAGEMSVTGSAGFSLTSTDETTTSALGQNDSVTISGSGETDGGLSITASFELDGDDSMDDRSFTVGSDTIGTFTFSGHGGSSVMGSWDDVVPHAYEESWAVTAEAGDDVVNGVGGDNLMRWDSPSIQGASVHIAYQDAEQTTGPATSLFSNLSLFLGVPKISSTFSAVNAISYSSSNAIDFAAKRTTFAIFFSKPRTPDSRV